MKRTICLCCIILLFTTLCLPLAANAETAFPTEAELSDIVDKAMLIRSVLGARRYPWDYETGSEKVEVTEEWNGVPVKFIYRLALEKYDEAGIRALVFDTLSKDYAEAVLQRNSSFFDGFKEIEGKLYYKEYGYTLANGFREYKRVEDGSLKVTERTGNAATVEVRFLPDINVRIFLVKEDEKWKIAGYDCREVLLNANGETMRTESFSEVVALEAIDAVIMEGYYYTGLNDQSTDTYYELGGANLLLEGSLAYPKTWENYLQQFATPELVKQVLFQNDGLKLRGDGLLERSSRRGNIDIYSIAEMNGVSRERLKIDSVNDREALCTYRLGYGNKEICTITVEFTKTDDGWRLSGGDFVDKMKDCFVDDGRQAVPETDTGDPVPVCYLLAVVVFICLATFKKAGKRR